MSFLLDTNVVSEFRKRDRADPSAMAWLRARRSDELHISVLTLGELRRGVERTRNRGDAIAAKFLEEWLAATATRFSGHIVDIDQPIAERWGRMGVPDPVSPVDGLIAATAIERDLTVATRNTRHFARTGARCTNPFNSRRLR